MAVFHKLIVQVASFGVAAFLATTPVRAKDFSVAAPVTNGTFDVVCGDLTKWGLLSAGGSGPHAKEDAIEGYYEKYREHQSIIDSILQALTGAEIPQPHCIRTNKPQGRKPVDNKLAAGS